MGASDGRLSWCEQLGYGAIAVAAGAAFPRLMSWYSRPARLGPRRLAAYIALNTMIGFALHTWALPYLRRMAADGDRARTELAQTLGRQPTDAELLEHLGVTNKR